MCLYSYHRKIATLFYRQLKALRLQHFSDEQYDACSTAASAIDVEFPVHASVVDLLKYLQTASGGQGEEVIQIVLACPSIESFQKLHDEPNQLNILKHVVNYVVQGLCVSLFQCCMRMRGGGGRVINFVFQ